MKLKPTKLESAAAVKHYYLDNIRTFDNLRRALLKVAADHCSCGCKREYAIQIHKLGCRYRQVIRFALTQKEYNNEISENNWSSYRHVIQTEEKGGGSE